MATGSEMILARYYAKRAIKNKWQKAGVKVQYADGKDLNLAAQQFLHEHLDELLGQARLTLEECSISSTITNTPRSPTPPTKGEPDHDHDHANNRKSNTAKEIA
jgi:hypothetical protein